MADTAGVASSRLDRRKARTRAALIRAAQAFMAAGRSDVAILEITQAADVGMGSFYNHFSGKAELFHAAVEDALDRHGALLDELTLDLDDPAETFAQSFRLTGRLHRRHPELSKVLLNRGLALTRSEERGVVPRARRDIQAAVQAGRFTVADTELALTVAAGTTLSLGQLLHDQPDRDDAQATDQITEDLLRLFGVPADQAREICRRPLPEPDDRPRGGTAA
ncbi:TetR/AcrR family transcriptional regulator [Thermoactinospora rubra]|uniref:TetR/AcrR family transcriptional regulator n=1 Tax=Thermoactinospora rubra TaxID=1088767 RepID=UPI000A10BA38|nr:TetR/AcrR family transcriptional regulator [Thermoactinospora rubra]